MNFESNKIQLTIFNGKFLISDRMPIKYLEITAFLILCSIFSIFFLGLAGIIYSIIFCLGYILFRFFAWIIWKKIEINIESRKLTTTRMVFNKETKTDIITNKFDFSNLILKEFEQSGMKRGMIQYKNHKLNDLMLLTHQKDIELLKNELFNKY
ncbi:MAG: hypothetical protein H6589_03865 [Flavobacteriales bacterium]|nr:hypothetical protein [Flavobacteriales bacterium]